jgi:hypothetical protein
MLALALAWLAVTRAALADPEEPPRPPPWRPSCGRRPASGPGSTRASSTSRLAGVLTSLGAASTGPIRDPGHHPGPHTYTVQPGDTLSGIAAKLHPRRLAGDLPAQPGRDRRQPGPHHPRPGTQPTVRVKFCVTVLVELVAVMAMV